MYKISRKDRPNSLALTSHKKADNIAIKNFAWFYMLKSPHQTIVSTKGCKDQILVYLKDNQF